MESNTTMQSFAMEIRISVEYLIQQFLDVGITKTRFDFVTQIEKEIVFKHMNCNKLLKFNKFSLQRKTRSTLHISSAGGKNKQVQIEVRKKRVYVVPNISQETDYLSVDAKTKKNTSLLINKSFNQQSDKTKSVQSTLNNQHATFSMDKSLKKDYLNVVVKDLLKTSIHDQKIKQSEQFFDDDLKFNIKTDISDSNKKNHLIKTNIKHNHNSFNQLTDLSVLKFKRDDNHAQLENEHRYNSRIRTKYRSAEKIVKQKRSSNRLYMSVFNGSDQRESGIALCRTKNKRKTSTLIQSFNKPVKMVSRNIEIGKSISVLELSNKMSVKSSYMIKVMMKLGVIATINQILDQETAQLIVEEFGHTAILRNENKLEEFMINEYNSNIEDVEINVKNSSIYKNRAPVVTIMGHVDHGKTSLLDYIRSTKIASSEDGGITQKLGAYTVNVGNKMITFLDTPGHEAFTSMRSRGIQLTDIVVLVVAVDDGVMPQTIESIKYIKSFNVPVVVAINKIDKSESNVNQIKQELNRYGLISEEWGGATQFVNVSAISGFGINDLLDTILLQSEVLELKVMHDGVAKAIVIESSLDKRKGPIVSVLVREGILKCGDVVLCGTVYGRIRAMYDEFGYDVSKAEPSIPVKLLGLSGIPDSGEIMIVVRNEKKAREVALYRQNKRREVNLARKQEELSLGNNVFSNMSSITKTFELCFIVKADTQGSVEVICESLKKLSNDKIIIKILSFSIGNIIETDAALALASHAIILGFNVKADVAIRRIVVLNKLDIRYYSVIYDLLNEVKQMIQDILTPKCTQKIIGLAEVHNVFKSAKRSNMVIAGCVVTQGMVKLNKKIKIVRNNVVIYKGELESLRRFKNDVNEVKSGVECGIGIKNYSDICSGDVIEILDNDFLE